MEGGGSEPCWSETPEKLERDRERKRWGNGERKISLTGPRAQSFIYLFFFQSVDLSFSPSLNGGKTHFVPCFKQVYTRSIYYPNPLLSFSILLLDLNSGDPIPKSYTINSLNLDIKYVISMMVRGDSCIYSGGS